MRPKLLTLAALAALFLGGLTFANTADARPRGYYGGAYYGAYRPYYGYRYAAPYRYYGGYRYPAYYYGNPGYYGYPRYYGYPGYRFAAPGVYFQVY